MSKTKVFLSHIQPEEDLAKLIRKDLLDAHLLSALDVFVSSDPAANPGGTSWLNNIQDNLRDASVILILASPQSITRPWINVEAGAGWVRYLQARAEGTKPVSLMPLCHSGLTPDQLPLPWSTFNAVEVRTEGGLQDVLDACASSAGLRSPRPNLCAIATEVQRLEQHYTRYREIGSHIQAVISTLGLTAGIFKNAPPPGKVWALKRVRQRDLDIVDVDLLWLMNEGYITYSRDGFEQPVGGPNAGAFTNISFAPTTKFLGVLPYLSL